MRSTDAVAGPAPQLLTLHGVNVHIGSRVLVRGATLAVPKGQMTGVVGPNGSGKTTLLRTVYRALRPAAGWVQVDDVDVWGSRPREVARRLAAVPQQEVPVDGQTVAGLVALGLLPHRGTLQQGEGRARIDAALTDVGLDGFAGRTTSSLSGGELQRARLARSLAQRPVALVLDEPTNHLDVRYQHDVLRLVRRTGVTTLCALHDLSLAARYCDALVLMDAGRVVAAGPPAQLLAGPAAQAVFGVMIEVLEHPLTGEPVVVTGPARP